VFGEQSVRGKVAVVTDSTATLPAPVTAQDEACLRLVAVVPLRLLAGGLVADDGDPEADAVRAAVARGDRLTTARPPPDRFVAVYRAAAQAGARGVISLHLPETLSGTIVSAELAAAMSQVPVRVVDAMTIGTGLGLTVLEAARSAAHGLGPDEVAARAARSADLIGSFFALAGPDALLAGGRFQTAGRDHPSSAALDQAQPRLVFRPILRIRSGEIDLIERVRTMAAAVSRLTDLAANFAGDEPADVAIEHTANAGRAADLGARLGAAMPRIRRRYVVASGAAIMAHVGHGMVGVTVAPHPADG
jgi:DegV family protein with EDD domain